MAQDLRRVYLHIVDDVIAKMKPEFVNEGVDEAVLLKIRERWEQRLREKGLLDEPAAQQAAAGPASRQSGPGPASTSAADAAGRTAQAGIKRPHDGAGPSQPGVKVEALAGGPTGFHPALAAAAAGAQMYAPTALIPGAVIAQGVLPGGLMPGHIPQTDGAGDGEEEEDDEDDEGYVGGDGDEEDAEEEEEEEEVGAEEEGGGGEDDGEGAGAGDGEEDDDDDDDYGADNDDELQFSDDEDKALEEDCTNIGFALYEKVHRAKTRWRLTLRHGVFHINGRDYLFNKAAGDLQFT